MIAISIKTKQHETLLGDIKLDVSKNFLFELLPTR